jgi:CheY-like chemotaxis protein
VDQAKGQTFLQAFNSLRGGGQITEAEGNKATQALARLDRAQSQQDFDAALSDIEAVVTAGLSRSRKAATRTPNVGAGSAANGTAPVQVSSPEEAMKLPSGTVFVTPDGRTKVRP